jgi:O-methyltransferase
LRNIRMLTASIVEKAIEGDFLEAGVWRGGACIYMRGLLAAYGINDRKVFAADSFAGLPPPQSELYPADVGDQHYLQPELAASLDEVKANFARFGLLDDQVVFLPGWFKDTLPTAPVKRLALLRLDGDMYGSTIETLTSLYPKVSAGGYVIIDDYILGPCRKAVEDFRRDYGCSESLRDIDGAGVFWQKQASS